MSTLRLPRPAPDEAAPYFQRYIALVSDDDVGERLLTQLAEVERIYATVTDHTSLARYAPGKWSIKEILGHMADAERIFTYRLLCIGRGDTTPLPGFDENAYVPEGKFDERPLSSLLAEFRAARLSSVALANGLPATAWSRRGEASGHSISARAIAFILVGHVAHHLGVLRERYGIGTSQGTLAGQRS